MPVQRSQERRDVPRLDARKVGHEHDGGAAPRKRYLGQRTIDDVRQRAAPSSHRTAAPREGESGDVFAVGRDDHPSSPRGKEHVEHVLEQRAGESRTRVARPARGSGATYPGTSDFAGTTAQARPLIARPARRRPASRARDAACRHAIA